MVKFAASFLLMGALCATNVNAQTPPDLQKSSKTDTTTPAPAPIIAPLGVGTAFNASLADTLDTRKTKAGDTVTAETAEDVSYQRTIVFPKGTKIVGHVVRVTSGGRGRTGSAIFVQFDKATIKDGQDVIFNAGIQALAVSGVAPLGAPKSDDASAKALPVEDNSTGSGESGDALVVSTLYQQQRSKLRPPLAGSLSAEGEFTSDGMFSLDSKGAFGRPDLKLYTPTSEGSHGTVLLSSNKNMHFEPGTHLLLVVQPPPTSDSDLPSSTPTDLDPQQ